MVIAMGTKMWTQVEQAVDKPALYTRLLTTPLEDVSRTVVSCGYKNQATVVPQLQFPQSPVLITVISSIYIHPHIAMTTSRQPGHGASL